MLVQVLVLSDSLIILLYAVETHFSADYFLGASQVAQVNICEDFAFLRGPRRFMRSFRMGMHSLQSPSAMCDLTHLISLQEIYNRYSSLTEQEV